MSGGSGRGGRSVINQFDAGEELSITAAEDAVSGWGREAIWPCFGFIELLSDRMRSDRPALAASGTGIAGSPVQGESGNEQDSRGEENRRADADGTGDEEELGI